MLSDYALQALRVVQYAPLIEVLSSIPVFGVSLFVYHTTAELFCSIILILIVIVVVASKEGWFDSEFPAFGDRSLYGTSRWVLQ